MEIPFCLLVGFLIFVGLILMAQNQLIKMVIGLSIFANAVNLLVFVMGGLGKLKAPLLDPTQENIPSSYADPLTQALILTSIVIGLALLVFLLTLTYSYKKTFNNLELGNVHEGGK